VIEKAERKTPVTATDSGPRLGEFRLGSAQLPIRSHGAFNPVSRPKEATSADQTGEPGGDP
jgi:hypothetical protein